MPSRGVAFTDEEDFSALDAIQDFLPLCETEWTSVKDAHNDNFPGKKREIASLKSALRN